MNSYILKIDSKSGAAGDMCLSAFFSLYGQLVDKGLVTKGSFDLVKNKLQRLTKKLGSDFNLKITEAERQGIYGIRIYLDYCGHKSHSHHATFNKLNQLIILYKDEELLTAAEADVASQILGIIAKAEAIAHSVSLDKVHFHEIGEEDSIFDIIANAVVIFALSEVLGDCKLHFTPIEVGHGVIDTSHGQLEIPAPATKYIIEEHSLKITNKLAGECLTPTGAAVLAYLKSRFLNLAEIDDIGILASGIGCGSLNPIDRANILRVELAE